jgi:predicted cobalt transporter CbtA
MVISMDSLSFLVVSLISGAIAGTILGVVNLVIVEPYLDKAIGIEVQNAIESGEKLNPKEHNNYRFWQKGGEVAAGTILGMAFGSLLGIVFAFGRRIISGSNLKKALVFSAIIWLVIFMVPAIKYPANPPTVGDPDTINYRQSLFISFILISGFTALGLAILYTKMKKSKTSIKFLTVSIIYAIVMICAFVFVPLNPDEITAPMELVNGFRIMSMITMTMFWIILGITFGLIWNKLKPHETTQFKTI